MKPSTVLIIAIAVFVTPIGSHATDLEDLISSLYGGDGITLQRNNENPDFSHHAHFTGASLQRLQSVSNAIAQVQIPGLATASGLQFEFDPILDDFVPTKKALGSVLGERPETLGQGRWSVGVHYGYAEYDKLDGQNLNQLQVDLQHLDVAGPGADDPCIGGPPPNCYAFEKDVVRIDMDISINSRYLALAGQYGVNDQWDIGISLPIIRNDVTINAVASIINDPSIQYFPEHALHVFDENNEDQRTDQAQGSNTGIGDLSLTSKHAFYRSESLGMAIQARIRLPTGDQKNLRGIDLYGGDLLWIAAHQKQLNNGLLTFRGNLGVGINVVRGGQDAINFLAGVEYDRTIQGHDVGVSAGILGQRGISHGGQSTLNRRDLSLGIKFRLTNAGLVNFGLITPLNDQGLRSTVSYSAGIEWAM